MSKFPHVAHGQGRTGRAAREAPDLHLSSVTSPLFPPAEPTQLLHPDPSSPGLSRVCDSPRPWTHRFAQVPFTAQQQYQRNTVINNPHRHLGLLIFFETPSSFSGANTVCRYPLTKPLPLQITGS